MSHIQKILERAERDGSIRPSVTTVTDAPRPLAATALATAEAVFPIVPVEPVPAPAPAPGTANARRQLATSQLHAAVLESVRSGSASADQFRTLRTRLQQAANGRTIHALIVTSPGRGEGRTQTAAGLALSMTREYDRRVCVVDANLRSPRLGDVFGVADGPGLADVLSERARLEDALVYIQEHNITVLPGGEATSQPELLGSIAMRRIMQSLRAQFDRIVIDAPPAIPVADVALLSPLVDGLMLVVRAGVTPKPAIHEAISGINSDKLLGVVLNDRR
jgi:capsular exopolysaccharide synthesis family protein